MDFTEIKGLHEVEFMNNRKTMVDVERVIVTSLGEILTLESKDGWQYNYRNVLRMRKVS